MNTAAEKPVAWLYELKNGEDLIYRNRKPDDGTWRAEFPLVIQPFAAPTPEVEPVAEITVTNNFGYDIYEAELIGAGVSLPAGTKLYAHPAPTTPELDDREILCHAREAGFALQEQPDESLSLPQHVWQFAKAIERRAVANALATTHEPFAWVMEFNDPDPQMDIEFQKDKPAGWPDHKCYPLYKVLP